MATGAALIRKLLISYAVTGLVIAFPSRFAFRFERKMLKLCRRRPVKNFIFQGRVRRRQQ